MNENELLERLGAEACAKCGATGIVRDRVLSIGPVQWEPKLCSSCCDVYEKELQDLKEQVDQIAEQQDAIERIVDLVENLDPDALEGVQAFKILNQKAHKEPT